MRRWWILLAALVPLLPGCSGGGDVSLVVTFENRGEDRIRFRAEAFAPDSDTAVPLSGGAVIELRSGEERGIGLTESEAPAGIERVRVYGLDDEVDGNATEQTVGAEVGPGGTVRLVYTDTTGTFAVG